MPESPRKPVKIAPPTGTRDFYPREMLVRRYITDAWRRTALRHGFDEIDGPTFESAELYKVKSGEGILNEMFGVFSGKAESARPEPRPSGSGSNEPHAPARGAIDSHAPASAALDPRTPPFGLRPEFTPTLARMYAARAKQLPQPTKWFCVSNFFRAERPQRGRLREFWQWNCDVIGGNGPEFDADTVECAIGMFHDLGVKCGEVQIRCNDRRALDFQLEYFEVPIALRASALSIIDGSEKRDQHQTMALVKGLEMGPRASEGLFGIATGSYSDRSGIEILNEAGKLAMGLLSSFADAIEARGIGGWCQNDQRIVRGLAYYTGTVFEVIAEGERAVAGGGRYDNLIELFGGPPTPACGFGMGDAVLGNLLEDRKLIPEGREMLEALARPMPYRPDVFVIASPNPGCEELIVPTVARLRRGEESEKYKQGECKPWSSERYDAQPLHARRSYKATKNVGKLLADAAACHARFAAIIESPETCTLKDMDRNEQTSIPLADLANRCAAG